MNYPNQKQIIIHREAVKSLYGRKFICAYQDTLSDAMKDLSRTGFQVYMCLLFNRNNYQLEFSPAYINSLTNLHTDTIRKAFKELEAKRYIIAKNDSNTLYEFYETPQERKKIIDEYSGKEYSLTFEELRKKVGILEAFDLWNNVGGNNL